MRVLDTIFPRTYHHCASLSGQSRRGRRNPPSKEGSMRNAIRSIAMLLAVLGAVTLPVFSATAWGAGERDVTIAQGIDAEFLDVQMTNNIVTLIINTSIYDTLLTRDKQLQLVPALATSYKLVSDKVWEVKLRQGVKFHNGEPFDASAVKFSFERINRGDFKSPQKGWFAPIEADQLQNLAATKTVRVEKTPSCRIIYFGIAQIKGGPLADRRVRQAINHAVDVQGIIDSVLLGNGKRINSSMPPNVWGYDPSIPFYDYNPKKAKELLAAAGQTNLTLTLQAPNGRWAMDKDIAQAVAGQLTENGIKTNVKIIGEWGSYVRSVLDHKTEDIFMNGWCLPSLEPDHWVTPNLHTGEPVSQYSNPEVDKLMEQARAEMNTDKRKQLYGQLLRLIHDDAPWLFGYQQMDIYGVNNRLKWTPRGDESIRLTEIAFY